MRKRPRLRLNRTSIGFEWLAKRWTDHPKKADPIYTVWCTLHSTRDEAIDYYNKVLEDFNAENN